MKNTLHAYEATASNTNTFSFSNDTETCFDSNGNRLAIQEISTGNTNEMSILWNQIFQRKTWIDSIIFLQKIGEKKYNFFVYERNGTFSSMCGNGAGTSLSYLFSKYGISQADFITLSHQSVHATIDEQKVSIQMWATQEISDVTNIIQVGFILHNISSYISQFLENPSLLSQKVKDENKLTYFLAMFQNLSLDEQFGNFVLNLQIKKFSSIAWEPHVLIDIWDTLKNTFLTSYYLKAISFLLRIHSNITGDINFMFFKQEKENTYMLYPSERWVDGGIHFDQTLSCGTGSVCLWSYVLAKHDVWHIDIVSRSWKQLVVAKENEEMILSYPRENISLMEEEEEKSYFSSQAILENFRYHIESKFGDMSSLSYQEILWKYGQNFPVSAQKIQKIFWDILFSSCLHESEFPIDPYKITSSIVGASLAKELSISQVYSPYLDTLQGELKSYPNVKLKSGKIFNKIHLLVDELSKYTRNHMGIKDVLKYITLRTQTVIDGIQGIKQPEIKEILKELEKNFESILWVGSSNIIDSEYGKFILELYKKLWIYDIVSECLPDLKEHQRHHFLISIIDKQIKNHIGEIYENFVKQLLRSDIPHQDAENTKKYIHKALQDSVITFFMQQNLSSQERKLLQEKQIIDTKWMFAPQLSSSDLRLKTQLSESLEEILTHEEFWIDFFVKYMSRISTQNNGKPVLLWEFNDEKNGFKKMFIYFIIDENKQKKLFMGKAKQGFEISFEYFVNLMKTPQNIINFQWCVMLLLLSLWNVPMIGSERWYREILIQTLQEHFWGKYEKYITFIKVSQLVWDYVPTKTCSWEDVSNYYMSFPAGSDNSYLQDIFSESLLSSGEFWKIQTKKLLENHFSHKIVSQEEQVIFLKELMEGLDWYNFQHILEKEAKKLIQNAQEHKLQNIEKIQQIIFYTWQEREKLLLNLYNRYLLLTKL